jgi:hypothetical protein
MMRRVEIKINGEWEPAKFEDIIEGDIFRLFEPTGEPVEDLDGNTVFTAMTDAFTNEDGIHAVHILSKGDH